MTPESAMRKLLKAHEEYCFLGAKHPEDHAAIIKAYREARKEVMRLMGDNTICLQPVSQLSPKAWDELQRIIKEDKGPNPALLRAASMSRKEIEAGRLIVERGKPQ